MSYTEFDGKPTLKAGDLADPDQMNDAFDGIQAEFEDRMEAHVLNGVISGMDCSINGTQVDIAAGEAYCDGKRYSGSASVTFSAADASGTYYIYIDPTDDASPYKKATSDPGAGYLVLATVDWDGSSTLSNLVDLRPWGLLPAAIRFSVVGALSTGTVGWQIIERNFWIEDVQILVGTTGTAGNTTVDVHVGDAGAAPSTIWSDASDRPSVAYTDADYSTATSGTPDTNRKATAGQIVQVVLDEVATGASDLAVVIRGRYY